MPQWLHDMCYINLGMWSSSCYIGNFIGPTVSGFLVDAYGFAWTSVVLFGVYVIILMIDIGELSYILNNCKTNNEYERLSYKHTEKTPLNQHKRESAG